MANTSYISPEISTRVQRSRAYEFLASLMTHLDALGINLVSITVTGVPAVITVTLNNPLPVDHEDHFKLTRVV